jgi:3-deoxy-D-manno-octulosonate 8-phosphate phosphatase (KDO 8-P phosphatase)
MARAAAARAIRLLVLDVDGVLTDGKLYYGPRGEQLKAFHVHDGYGIQALRSVGVRVAVISGRRSEAVRQRCRELGIREIHQGIADKAHAFELLIKRLGIAARDCACIGDDTPDVALMQRVGIAFSVSNAHADARRAAHRHTKLAGGSGAVREVCDWILRSIRDDKP